MIGILSGPLNPERQTHSSLLVGSEVAKAEFLTNLLRHSPSDSVGLFATESMLLPIRQEVIRLQENQPELRRPYVWGISSLPKILAQHQFTAFHNPTAPQLHQLSYLRSQFAPHPFPITCVIHGFSQSYLLWEFFARLLLTPTLPCDSVLCTSLAAQQAFHKMLAQVRTGLEANGATKLQADPRLDIMPLGVDIELYKPRNRPEVRSLLGLPQEKTLLLYFGRMDYAGKADMNPLLIAFSELLNKHQGNIILVLAGASPEQEQRSIMQADAQLGCGNHILIRPNPSLIEGPLYYSASDIFISLSDTLQESFGLSLLEAMSSGLPVIASDWSGYHESVIHSLTGFRIKTYWGECDEKIAQFAPLQNWREDHLHLSQTVAVDIDELIQSLDTLISDLVQRSKMGIAARDHIIANYAWKRVIERHWALWEELAQIASTLPNLPPQSQGLIRPNYFRNYSHFAVQLLSGPERLSITERGRKTYHHPEKLLTHPEMQPLLNRKILMVILKVIKMADFFKYGLTVEDICSRIGPKHNLDR